MSEEPDMTRRRTLQSLTLPSLLLPVLGAGTAATPAAAQESGDGRSARRLTSRAAATPGSSPASSSDASDADLLEIRTVEPYPADYEETVARAQRERDAAATPALAERVADDRPLRDGVPRVPDLGHGAAGAGADAS